MSIATPFVPPRDGLDIADQPSRLSLYQKLSRVQDEYLAGRLTNLKVPDHLIQANAQAVLNDSKEDTVSFLPTVSGADTPADALPGLPTHPSPARVTLNPQPETQQPTNGRPTSPSDDGLEDGEVEQTETTPPESAPAQKLDTLMQSEEKVDQEPIARSQPFWKSGQELQITDPRDYPYLDLAPIIAQARALVPPFPGAVPTRTKSFSTESLYSSRGTWSAKGSPQQVDAVPLQAPVTEEMHEAAVMEISSNEDMDEGKLIGTAQPALNDNDYSPSDERVDYGPFPATPPYAAEIPAARKDPDFPPPSLPRSADAQVPEPVEIPSDDDWLVGRRKPVNFKASYGNINALNDDSTSSQAELNRPEEEDYDPESDIEYEPPGAGAFGSGSRRGGRPLPPFKPYPGNAKMQQVNGNNNASKQQRVAGYRQSGPQQQRGKQPVKKRRRLDYPADPRKRVQQQVALDSPSSQYYTEPSSAESFIKQEPVSPPPLLPPEQIPLPETPPLFSRRQSGYGSDLNGYESRDHYYDRPAPTAGGQAPANTSVSRPRTNNAAPTMSSSVASYNPRRAEPDAQVAAPRSKDPLIEPLKIVAIGRNNGKFFYNRPIRPGDLIPEPDAEVQYIDDPMVNAPPAPTVQQRAVSSYPEPSRNASYHERVYEAAPQPHAEQRLLSHDSAARTYSTYPDAAPLRAYSMYPGEHTRVRYHSPQYGQEAYGRPEVPSRGLDYPSARGYATHADPSLVPEPQLGDARGYHQRPEYGPPAATDVAVVRAYSTRPDYPPPAPEYVAYERERASRAHTGRPEVGPVATASEYGRAYEYWARPQAPSRAFDEPYPPRSREPAPFHRSQSVRPSSAYSPAAPILNHSSQCRSYRFSWRTAVETTLTI